MKVIILIIIMIFCAVNGDISQDGSFLVREAQTDLVSPECLTTVTTEKKYLLTHNSAKENYEMQYDIQKMSRWWVYLVNLKDTAFSNNTDYPKIEKILDNLKFPGNKEYDAIFEIFNSAQIPADKMYACSLYCSSYQGEILPFFPATNPATNIDWFRSSFSFNGNLFPYNDNSSNISDYNTKIKVERVENFIRNVEFPGIVKGVFWLGRGGNNISIPNYRNIGQTIPQEYYLAIIVDYNVQEKQYAVSSFYQKDKNKILYYPSKPVSWNEWKDTYKDHPDFHKFYETLIAHLGVEINPLSEKEDNGKKIQQLDDLLSRGYNLSPFQAQSEQLDNTYFDRKDLLFAGTEVFDIEKAKLNENKLWWVSSRDAAQAIEITDENIDSIMELLDTADIKTYVGGFPKWNVGYKYTPRIRYIIPIDDYKHNSNPPIFKNAPDMRLYFGLYAKEFHAEFVEEKPSFELSPGKFSSFLDYAKYKLYMNAKDNAIYNVGDKLSSYKMNPDQPPEEAYYYAHDKDGTMRPINDKAPRAFDRNFNPETAKYLLVRSEQRITQEKNKAANFWSGTWIIGGLFHKNRTIAIPIDLDSSVGISEHPKPELAKLGYSEDDIEGYCETEEFAELKKILGRNINTPQNLANESVPEFDTNGVKLTGEGNKFIVNINPLDSNQTQISPYYLGRYCNGSCENTKFDTAETKFNINVADVFREEITFTFDVIVRIREEIEETDDYYNVTKRIEEKCINAGSVAYTQRVTPTFTAKLRSKRGYWRQERKISDILSDAAASVAEAINSPSAAISGGLKNIHFRPNEEYKKYKGAEFYIGNARDGNRRFASRDSGYIKYNYLYDEFGATAGHSLQIYERVTGKKALIRPYQQTAIYLKLRFPVIPIDSFNVAPIVGYIYYGDTGFCGSSELLSYVKREIFSRGDSVFTYEKLPEDTISKTFIKVIREEAESLYVRYDAATNKPMRIESDVYIEDEYTDACADSNKIYYTFLLEQRKNLIRPGWTSYSNFNIEMWAASGYDQLGNSRINEKVLEISDNAPEFNQYWKEDKDDGKITSWLTPYYQPGWKEEGDDYPYSSGDNYSESFKIRGLTHLLIYDKSETLIDLVWEYNKRTKEYYTDQKDINERDKDIEGGEAWWKIALKIVVAESFNISMKVLHKMAEKYKYLQPVEASAIMLQDKVSNNIAYKIAKEAYRTYCIWRTTMDTAAEIRDRAKDAKEAWQGLQETFNGLRNYYTEFDWKSVKMTNISKVLPSRQIYYFKGNLNYFESSADRLMDAIDRMAFHSDTTFRGNYGLLNPLINWASAKLATGLQSTFEASDRILDLIGVDYSFGCDYDSSYAEKYGTRLETDNTLKKNSEYMDKLTAGKRKKKGLLDSLTESNDTQDGRAFSRAAYLSNITILAKSAVHEVSMDVLNDEISAMAVTLSTIESDSKSWLQYVNYQEEWGERFQKNFNASDYYDTNGVLKKGKSALKGFMRALDYPNQKVFSSGADNALYQLQNWSKDPQAPRDGYWGN